MVYRTGRKRQAFRKDFKAKAVLGVLREESTIQEIAGMAGEEPQVRGHLLEPLRDQGESRSSVDSYLNLYNSARFLSLLTTAYLLKCMSPSSAMNWNTSGCISFTP